MCVRAHHRPDVDDNKDLVGLSRRRPSRALTFFPVQFDWGTREQQAPSPSPSPSISSVPALLLRGWRRSGTGCVGGWTPQDALRPTARKSLPRLVSFSSSSLGSGSGLDLVWVQLDPTGSPQWPMHLSLRLRRCLWAVVAGPVWCVCHGSSTGLGWRADRLGAPGLPLNVRAVV